MSKVAELFESLDYGPAPESADSVRAWIEANRQGFRMYVGGEWIEPADGDYFDTHDPANGSVLARVPQASSADIDSAVAAARNAFAAWSVASPHERARWLYALARQIQKHARFLAVLETLDNGKPIRESRDIDVPLVARHFYHHAGWAQLIDDEFPDHRPVGVVGQIIPWNFPLLMLAWKVAPALAAGNTVVLKPAEYTSLTALRFAEICHGIGLPAGVVNIVTGDGRAGELIVNHEDVDKIAFTGSTEVGRIIRRATAGTGRKLSLELGGKSPFIVFDDADLDAVVEGVVDAIWFNQGQVCCAGSRILAQEGIAESLVAKLRERMERLRTGDPLDKAVDIGAIIAPVQLERIESLVARGREEGATIWQPSWTKPENGWFYPPTLCTNVAPAATIAQVEIFGPVVVMMTFRTPTEAVALANNTRYGLAASIWSESINLALDIAPQVRAGSVWINCTNVFDAASGFGGYRESGFGREGGREGMWEYLVAAHADEPAEPAGSAPAERSAAASAPPASTAGESVIDRTRKLYIGGKQRRPDQGYTMTVAGVGGKAVGEVGIGNRKDIREAVEAAHRAAGWARTTAHNRAQVIYYIAENLSARHGDFADLLAGMTGGDGRAEVDAALERLFEFAARADKYDGAVHATPFRNVTLAMPEPVGVLGIVCPDEAPLLGFVSAVFAPVALGNTVIAVPSERWPLAATDFHQVLDTSDVPGGVVNIVTGTRADLARVLAAHDDVDGIWYFAADNGGGEVERLSADNMKRTWVAGPGMVTKRSAARTREMLRHATEVKNIWIPYGE
jgi:aldehyde dehydrogenase (NAD+)